jgi:hypothetical protein
VLNSDAELIAAATLQVREIRMAYEPWIRPKCSGLAKLV